MRRRGRRGEERMGRRRGGGNRRAGMVQYLNIITVDVEVLTKGVEDM